MTHAGGPVPHSLVTVKHLPAYARTAIGNYLTLAAYVCGVGRALPDPVQMAYAGADPTSVVRSYEDSGTAEPLLTALEADIRRVMADPAIKAVARLAGKSLPPVGWARVGRALGWRAAAAPLPARPDLKALLIRQTTDEKATELERALLRLLKDGDRQDRSAGIAAFVRAARFTTDNPTRDRKLVEAMFAHGPRTGLRLAKALLDGCDLFGLTPFVLDLATPIAAQAGMSGWATALATRALARGAAPFAEAVARTGAVAALRAGQAAEAGRIADAWQAIAPDAAGPLTLSAAARLGDDPIGAEDRLRAAAARPTDWLAPAAALLAKSRTAAGDALGAERALRLALAQGGSRTPLLAALHNLQVERGAADGGVSTLFSGGGAALRWRRFHPDLLVDQGPGRGGGAGTTPVTVVLPAERGADALTTTIASVLDQSHSRLELIVVVPGGRSTGFDLRPVADPRLRLLPSDASTLGDLVQAGVDATSSKLVAIAREGDFWLRDLLVVHLAARRGDAKLAVSRGAALTAAQDGRITVGVLGNPTEPSSRAILFDRRALQRTGPFDGDAGEAAVSHWLGRAFLQLGPDGVRTLDAILSVAPPTRSGALAGEHEERVSRAWREVALACLVTDEPAAEHRARPIDHPAQELAA